MQLTIIIAAVFTWYYVVDAWGDWGRDGDRDWHRKRERGPEMSTWDFVSLTHAACRIDSTELWNKMIDCHRPITDEFMRASPEANCPRTASDPDPSNTTVSMIRVFQTFCNTVGTDLAVARRSASCLNRTHPQAVIDTQEKFGFHVPDMLVRCHRKIDVSQYERSQQNE